MTKKLEPNRTCKTKRRNYFSIVSLAPVFILAAAFASPLGAQNVIIDAQQLISRVEVFFSPRTGSFVEGSTFDMPILINTRGISINGLEIRVTFDRDKLEIVKPSTGQSIIGVWIEPPSYDNTRGIASYIGVVPNGITTSAGHVGTITFRAKKIGKAVISISPASKVLLNDGQGSEAQIDLGRSEYTILGKAPEGVRVYSETHPYPSEWYNNNSPVLFWDSDQGVEGYSFTLDNAPSTIPESKILTTAPTQAFKNLGDGLWYFHIKASKNGVWGTTGHFLIRVDTSPPAVFTPKLDYLVSSADSDERALVSFITTDNLSGIDHYEVGVLDGNQPATVSPVFVHAESPFQVPLSGGEMSVIVRAVDKAGNIKDATITAGALSPVWKFIKEKLAYILLFTFLAGFIAFVLHYIVGHLIMWYLRKAIEVVRNEERAANVVQIPPPPPRPPRRITPISYPPSPYEITSHYPEDR